MADSNIVRNGDFSAGIEPWYPNGCEAFVVSSDPFSSDSISDSPSCGYACRIPKLFAKANSMFGHFFTIYIDHLQRLGFYKPYVLSSFQVSDGAKIEHLSKLTAR
ncbi:unnamed protein product [Microthlaspi erraticum]|uniref:Uncharacterized protein n=1 Tax=Microthlaspi erraticum TaxID=1685480 RepID=A0A6D2IZ45_9BRAS|nr:unnamed protein product [Microthlaspi erraticum]CAA7052800.1 unnamed protein product [Microthlaspi erraticum]